MQKSLLSFGLLLVVLSLNGQTQVHLVSQSGPFRLSVNDSSVVANSDHYLLSADSVLKVRLKFEQEGHRGSKNIELGSSTHYYLLILDSRDRLKLRYRDHIEETNGEYRLRLKDFPAFSDDQAPLDPEKDTLALEVPDSVLHEIRSMNFEFEKTVAIEAYIDCCQPNGNQLVQLCNLLSHDISKWGILENHPEIWIHLPQEEVSTLFQTESYQQKLNKVYED